MADPVVPEPVEMTVVLGGMVHPVGPAELAQVGTVEKAEMEV